MQRRVGQVPAVLLQKFQNEKPEKIAKKRLIGKDLFPKASKKMQMKKPAEKEEQQETNQGEESAATGFC